MFELKKGDKVELEISMDVNVEKIKLAVSGGALLVKDGKPLEEFSHMIYGSHCCIAASCCSISHKAACAFLREFFLFAD